MHYSKVSRRSLTEEVCHWLEGLLLSHDESDSSGLLVSHQSGVSSTSLLELLVSMSVESSSDLEDALFQLFTVHLLHLWKV